MSSPFFYNLHKFWTDDSLSLAQHFFNLTNLNYNLCALLAPLVLFWPQRTEQQVTICIDVSGYVELLFVNQNIVLDIIHTVSRNYVSLRAPDSDKLLQDSSFVQYCIAVH